MDSYRLRREAWLLPTPAGAYQAACGAQPGPVREFLFSLLRLERSRPATVETLCRWTGEAAPDAALGLLHRLQTLGLVQGEDAERSAPQGPLEQVLPPLLAPLSGSGRALLADGQGLYICRHGFTHETAEELAALSADLAALHQRHRGLLRHNLNLPYDAWALADAAGNSRVGFWPLHIGDIRFVLVLSDEPRLNQTAFRDLVWTLGRRYLAPENHKETA